MGRPTFPRQRSRGQLARRNSITRGSDKVQDGHHKRRSHGSTGARLPRTSPSAGRASREERPWLGGLYFTDLVFIAFTYSVNLLRTCGLAELADIAFKGLVYVCECDMAGDVGVWRLKWMLRFPSHAPALRPLLPMVSKQATGIDPGKAARPSQTTCATKPQVYAAQTAGLLVRVRDNGWGSATSLYLLVRARARLSVRTLARPTLAVSPHCPAPHSLCDRQLSAPSPEDPVCRGDHWSVCLLEDRWRVQRNGAGVYRPPAHACTGHSRCSARTAGSTPAGAQVSRLSTQQGRPLTHGGAAYQHGITECDDAPLPSWRRLLPRQRCLLRRGSFAAARKGLCLGRAE